MTRTSACAIAVIPVCPCRPAVRQRLSSRRPRLGWVLPRNCVKPARKRPAGGVYSKTDARTARRVSCQRLTEIETRAPQHGHVADCRHARRQAPTPGSGWSVWNLDVRGSESGVVGEGSRQRRLSMTASKRGISGAMSYSRTSATVIQSPACCAFEQRRQLRVERAQQRHRRAFARLERLEGDAARGGGGDDELHQVGDRLGELADAARRGVDLGAAQDRRRARTPTRRRPAASGWPRRGRCRAGRSGAASRSRRSARCPGPGRGPRRRGSPARRPRRSAPPRRSPRTGRRAGRRRRAAAPSSGRGSPGRRRCHSAGR